MAEVKVSWLTYDSAATASDVRVSWLAYDTSATPCDVRVSWLAYDSAASATNLFGGPDNSDEEKHLEAQRKHAERLYRPGEKDPRNFAETPAEVVPQVAPPPQPAPIPVEAPAVAPIQKAEIDLLSADLAEIQQDVAALASEAIANAKRRRDEEELILLLLM